MRYSLSTCIAFLLLSTISFSQAGTETAGRISPKELNIPPSPVFDLMGVTPAQINHTSDIKDFKVDWSFKSWKLNPNLAIQSQPIWEMFYNRKDLHRYQDASPFMRRLSTFDASIGSVQDENNDRRIGFAFKLNLVKQKDPLMEKSLYTDILERYAVEKKDLEKKIGELQKNLDTTKNILEKPGIRSQLASAEEALLSVRKRQQEEINGRAKIFVEENWNASWLDVSYGRIYTYKTDSAGSLTSLRLNRNTGRGSWINGGFGIGKKCLITGLFRITWYQEQLDFSLKNKITGEVTTAQSVADNTLYSGGINFRYGGAIYKFFAEFLYEQKGIKTPVQALSESFKVPANDLEIVSSSVKWSVVHPYTFSMGGDWRISQGVIINYGMRFLFTKEWHFQTFTPVATISCMMR